jgi:hypothetical protein
MIGQATVLVIMYVETFQTDVIVLMCNFIMSMTPHWPIFDITLTDIWHHTDRYLTSHWPIFDITLTDIWHHTDRYLTSLWPIFDTTLTDIWHHTDRYLTPHWPIFDTTLTDIWHQTDRYLTSHWPIFFSSLIVTISLCEIKELFFQINVLGHCTNQVFLIKL